MTALAHRRATMPSPHVTPALARGHLRTCLGPVRWERERVVEEARLLAAQLRVETRIRLEFGLLFHTQAEVELFGMYLMATGQVALAVALCEAWERNPHRVVA